MYIMYNLIFTYYRLVFYWPSVVLSSLYGGLC